MGCIFKIWCISTLLVKKRKGGQQKIMNKWNPIGPVALAAEKKVSVLLSALVERFSIYRDFFSLKNFLLCIFFAFCVIVMQNNNFHQLGPLSRVGRIVDMSVCLSGWCPLPMRFFSRPLIGPQVTWSVRGLWLVNTPSLPNFFCFGQKPLGSGGGDGSGEG